MTRAISQERNLRSEGIPKDEVSKGDPDAPESKRDPAAWHMTQSRYEDAEPLLLEALHGRETKLGPKHPHTIDSLKQLVTLYESWGEPDEAATSHAKLPKANAAQE